jgi:Tfp pilus assembly protein PilO
MRFKILLVPFFLIVILILCIGYIKPDFDTIFAKKEELSVKKDQVANMENVLENVKSLNNSLDTNQDAEKFMYRYLPLTLNQEQVIDAFNFIANQSGLVITDMELKQMAGKVAEEPLIDSTARSFVAGGKSLESSNIPYPAPKASAKTFVFKGSIVGPYANIKAFFERLSHIERFQHIRSFSIKTSEKTESGTGTIEQNKNNLIGAFEAEYDYLPPRVVASALGIPIFLQSEFDFSSVSALISKITNPIPALEKGVSGKPNPFQ